MVGSLSRYSLNAYAGTKKTVGEKKKEISDVTSCRYKPQEWWGSLNHDIPQDKYVCIYKTNELTRWLFYEPAESRQGRAEECHGQVDYLVVVLPNSLSHNFHKLLVHVEKISNEWESNITREREKKGCNNGAAATKPRSFQPTLPGPPWGGGGGGGYGKKKKISVKHFYFSIEYLSRNIEYLRFSHLQVLYITLNLYKWLLLTLIMYYAIWIYKLWILFYIYTFPHSLFHLSIRCQVQLSKTQVICSWFVV